MPFASLLYGVDGQPDLAGPHLVCGFEDKNRGALIYYRPCVDQQSGNCLPFASLVYGVDGQPDLAGPHLVCGFEDENRGALIYYRPCVDQQSGNCLPFASLVYGVDGRPDLAGPHLVCGFEEENRGALINYRRRVDQQSGNCLHSLLWFMGWMADPIWLEKTLLAWGQAEGSYKPSATYGQAKRKLTATCSVVRDGHVQSANPKACNQSSHSSTFPNLLTTS